MPPSTSGSSGCVSATLFLAWSLVVTDWLLLSLIAFSAGARSLMSESAPVEGWPLMVENSQFVRFTELVCATSIFTGFAPACILLPRMQFRGFYL